MITLVTGLTKSRKPIMKIAFESKVYFNGSKKLNLENMKEVSIISEILKCYNLEKDPESFEDLETYTKHKLNEDPNIFIRNCINNRNDINDRNNLIITDWKHHNEKYFLLEMGYFPTTVRLFDTFFSTNYLEDTHTDFLIVENKEQFSECLKRYPQYSSFREYCIVNQCHYKELLDD
jgi:hypothetical protein